MIEWLQHLDLKVAKQHGNQDMPEWLFWTYLGISAALVGMAGLMSGLTLGLMSLDEIDLEVCVLHSKSSLNLLSSLDGFAWPFYLATECLVERFSLAQQQLVPRHRPLVSVWQLCSSCCLLDWFSCTTQP